MKRLWATVWLLAFLTALVLASSWLVYDTNKTLLGRLEEIGSLNDDGQYEQARQAIGEMEDYFSHREHWMALFIKRDQLTGIALCLGGLRAYVGPDNAQDLHSELGKARTQVEMTGHLFFSMF